MNVSIDEGIIITIFRKETRNASIKKMKAALQYIHDEEMEELIKRTGRKVKNMTKEEYDTFDVSQYQKMLDDYGDEEEDEEDEW